MTKGRMIIDFESEQLVANINVFGHELPGIVAADELSRVTVKRFRMERIDEPVIDLRAD